MHDAAVEGRLVQDHEVPMMISPAHVRHCIDLLRHAVMCEPDITIEKKGDKAQGVTGFGTSHVCKDWQQLVKWTSAWESWRPELGY